MAVPRTATTTEQAEAMGCGSSGAKVQGGQADLTGSLGPNGLDSSTINSIVLAAPSLLLTKDCPAHALAFTIPGRHSIVLITGHFCDALARISACMQDLVFWYLTAIDGRFCSR